MLTDCGSQQAWQAARGAPGHGRAYGERAGEQRQQPAAARQQRARHAGQLQAQAARGAVAVERAHVAARIGDGKLAARQPGVRSQRGTVARLRAARQAVTPRRPCLAARAADRAEPCLAFPSAWRDVSGQEEPSCAGHLPGSWAAGAPVRTRLHASKQTCVNADARRLPEPAQQAQGHTT